MSTDDDTDLTYSERVILDSLPEHWRAAFIRECRLSALAAELGLDSTLVRQQLEEFVR